MSREIEFRAKTKDGLFRVITIDFVNGCCLLIDEDRANQKFYEWKDIQALDQYTGLKDKNGKKIFEGDIISCDFWNPKDYIVHFVDGGFCFGGKCGYHNDMNMIYDSKGIHFEITGNIHDA